MKKEFFKEIVEILENNDLIKKHKDLYTHCTLVLESIELSERQEEVGKKLQELNNPKKK